MSLVRRPTTTRRRPPPPLAMPSHDCHELQVKSKSSLGLWISFEQTFLVFLASLQCRRRCLPLIPCHLFCSSAAFFNQHLWLLSASSENKRNRLDCNSKQTVFTFYWLLTSWPRDKSLRLHSSGVFRCCLSCVVVVLLSSSSFLCGSRRNCSSFKEHKPS